MTTIGILTKPRVAIATVSEYEIIWLQYSLQHALDCEVHLLDLKKATGSDTGHFDWLIIDCTATFMDRTQIERLLSGLHWKPGRVIVRFGSTREFEGEIDGVHVLSWHAKAPEYTSLMREAAYAKGEGRQ